MDEKEKSHGHFGGQDALHHMVAKQSEGKETSAEMHGSETPGHLWAGADAAKECAVLFVLIGILLHKLGLPSHTLQLSFFFLGLGWMVWKGGRSAMLGWSHLERLHRVLEEERWEIEHHRDQEREELTALYAAKGFEGQLLEDVVEVLMADGDRLLRVMLEEELGLTLESQEHPLKQGLCAALGAAFPLVFIGLGSWTHPTLGPFFAATLSFFVAVALPTWYEKNRLIPALIWNLGMATLACGLLYFLLDYAL